MKELKAIETLYKGYRFRSRLEARWAAFLDELSIAYQYEPEGFNLGGVWYLPDFYLPAQESYLEIKPKIPTEDERMKAGLLAAHSGKKVCIVYGNPYPGEFGMIPFCMEVPSAWVSAFSQELFGAQAPAIEKAGLAVRQIRFEEKHLRVISLPVASPPVAAPELSPVEKKPLSPEKQIRGWEAILALVKKEYGSGLAVCLGVMTVEGTPDTRLYLKYPACYSFHRDKIEAYHHQICSIMRSVYKNPELDFQTIELMA